MALTTHLKNINNKRMELENDRFSITRQIVALFTKRDQIDNEISELHAQEFMIDTGKPLSSIMQENKTTNDQVLSEKHDEIVKKEQVVDKCSDPGEHGQVIIDEFVAKIGVENFEVMQQEWIEWQEYNNLCEGHCCWRQYFVDIALKLREPVPRLLTCSLSDQTDDENLYEQDPIYSGNIGPQHYGGY
jgi:hypothetical protein